MAERRVVVLGAGSSGEHFVGALRRLDPDVEITVVERELAGGECSYYACLPTKTLLRPTEVLAAARLAPGAAEAITGEIDVERVLWWRDQVTDGRDDSWHVGWLEEQGAELVRGDARVRRAGVVAVGERDARVRRARRRDRLGAGAAPARRARGRRVLDEPRRGLGERDPSGASSSSVADRSASSSRSSSGAWARRSRSSSTTRTCSRGSMPMQAACWPQRFEEDGIRVRPRERKPSASSRRRAGSA